MNRTIFALALLAASCLAAADAPHGVHSARPEAVLRPASTSMLPSPVDPTRDHVLDELTLRLEAIIRSWPRATLPVCDLHEVAEDIAEASLERGSTRPIDDGILLAALGYWEGARFLRYVDDGSCNEKEWRGSPEGSRSMHIGGDCDGGRAKSLWQIHPIEVGPLTPSCSSGALATSRLQAARCALVLAEGSLNEWGSLAGYTGESPTGFHPKADLRLEWARRAATSW